MKKAGCGFGFNLTFLFALNFGAIFGKLKLIVGSIKTDCVLNVIKNRIHFYQYAFLQ